MAAEIPPFPPGVSLTTLDNGLTVIVREDHSAPVVSAQAWCRAGSIHEGKWLGAGLSHLLEHMLFKGTTSRPGARIDQEVQAAGGSMNAYTSFDRTVYHIDVPNTGTQVALSILCDIMQAATLPADELAKEKDVISREMDMNTDDPGRRSGRRLFETAYTRSPYRFTVIGYPDIFHELKPEDIHAYYREQYAPNNVFFVVAGDVSAGAALDQIRQAYAHAKARAHSPFVLPEEPPQTAPRETIEEAPIELGQFHLAWHIPDLRHPDAPALDVLAALLGHGRSSRLYQKVREQLGLVTSADAWTYSPGGTGLFGMSATFEADKFAAAKQALLQEVEQIQTAAVPTDELTKTVKQFVAATLATRKTMRGQAQDLGANWLSTNDLNFSQRYLVAVQQVLPADLQRVAQRYLTTERRTLYALLPEGHAPKASAVLEGQVVHRVEKIDFPNGLRLLLKEDTKLPFVEFRAVLKGGVLLEDPAQAGISQLMARMLLKGTQHYSAEQLVTRIESVGGSIDIYSGNNSFGVTAEVLSGDWRLGLDLVTEVLLRPSFPSAALERERAVQLASIRDQKDQLLQSSFKAMRQALFGPAGYGLDPLGSEQSVKGLGVANLTTWHQNLVRPGNCVLAIYGDVRPGELRAAVSQSFAKWTASAGGGPVAPGSGRPALTGIKRITETRDKKQAVLVLAVPGTTVDNPDRYGLDLLQEACSDLGSRLFLRIREKLGLAYYVGAQNFVGLAPGYFAFYAGTSPEKAALVEAELLEEIRLLRAEGLAAEELQRAQAKIIGQRKISRQDLGALAMAGALDEIYGLGYAHADTEDALYAAVTLDDVKRVTRQYLTPEAFVLTVIRPE
jgi:zinc protease